MSYFNDYFDRRGRRTLRTYSRPVNLTRFDHLHWMTSEKPAWFIAEYLCDITHVQLLAAAQAKSLTMLDKRSLSAGLTGRTYKSPK
jgi:hypothetical protein